MITITSFTYNPAVHEIAYSVHCELRYLITRYGMSFDLLRIRKVRISNNGEQGESSYYGRKNFRSIMRRDAILIMTSKSRGNK